MKTEYKNITQEHDGRYALRLNGTRHGRYPTLEEAVLQKAKIMINDLPVREQIEVQTPKPVSGDEWLQKAINLQNNIAYPEVVTKEIFIPHKKFILWFISDLHIGDEYTNYKLIKEHVEMIQSDERIYCIFLGDFFNNYIKDQLAFKQRDALIPLAAELEIGRSIAHQLSNNMLAAIPGNHDLWTLKDAGIDIVDLIFRDIKMFYDQNLLKLNIGNDYIQKIFALKHHWAGNTKMNLTKGIENGWDQIGPFDFGIGGHLHAGNLIRQFIRFGKIFNAILMGSYKYKDSYADYLGVPGSLTPGSCAVLFDEDKWQWYAYPELAVKGLN